MARSIGLKDKDIDSTRTLDFQTPTGTRKSWSCTYLVVTAGTHETDEDAMAATGVPPLRALINNGYLISKSAQEIDASANLWEVECRFDSHVDADRPVIQYSWDIEEREEVLEYDAVTGLPVKNSAGEKILTTMLNSIPVLTVTRLESFFSPNVILQYNNRVNADVFLGAPPRCALLTGPIARQVLVNALRVWECTYRIKFNLRITPKQFWDDEELETVIMPHLAGWGLYLLDEGNYYSYQDDDGNIITGTFTKDGEPVKGNLDGKGAPLGLLQPEVFLNYNRYPLARFELLGLV